MRTDASGCEPAELPKMDAVSAMAEIEPVLWKDGAASKRGASSTSRGGTQ